MKNPDASFVLARYVSDEDERMLIYKRIAHMTDPAQVQALEDELKDRFGELPRPAQDLLDLARVKLEAQLLGILLVGSVWLNRPSPRRGKQV